jgi:hypothetical protein
MRGQAAQGDDALTADEQVLLDANRNDDGAAATGADAAGSADGAQDDAQGGAPEGDPAAGDAAQADKAAQQPKMVPHQALHEERRARQETEQRLAEERKSKQILEQRMNLLLERYVNPQQQQTAQQQPAQQAPDINTDPVGHLKFELAQRDQVLQALVQAVSGQSQHVQQNQAVSQLAARASAMEREFSAQTPDYQQAYEHLVDGRRRELVAAGWNDPGEIQAFMAREAIQLAHNALEKGMNPAAVVYELAKIRGYQPKSPNDGAAAPNASQQPDPAAVEKLQTIAQGQQQGRGLNRVPGQSSAPVTATAIANMSDEEFAAWAKKAPPTERRRIMGA